MLPTHQFSPRNQHAQAAMRPFFRFFEFYNEHAPTPGISNFALGNPHDMPLSGVVDALQRWSVPQNKDWFGYQFNEPQSQAIIAESLYTWRGIPFEPDDIHLTTGAFSALAITLNTIVSEGDEIIYNTPPWFFYEPQILAAGGVPVSVKVDPATFDLDLNAITTALTPRTRAIIVNSPNNPTGKIYPPATLRALADLLTQQSQQFGHPIYLISDEAYSRIVYTGQAYHSATEYYPNTFLIYTYGKTLLTPGQRIGYIALPPTMPDRESMRQALIGAQVMTGYAFPNALLQHALADLDKLSIDLEHLQAKRDGLVTELRSMGYDVHVPEGTFYLLPKSPLADDWQFIELLAQHNILCLPGAVVELPGYFRISLTANDEMIRAALPNFAAALERAY
ncbi:MAG TPA: aminotransferase class I/II-fold pyridoxal phosphate-dependent enzyme [Aggregatilineaceae bacterium]|nr:aminotransferase class I/II-fold pyridoxal phosphate-dependent enzyme [Aggregatilineaceae bacterium]